MSTFGRGTVKVLLQYGNVTVDRDWVVEEKMPPGYSRVYYVYGGEVIYNDDQQKIPLQAGSLYIFPSASPYSMKQNPQNRLNCTYFHIDIFPALTTDLVEVPVYGNPVVNYLLRSIAESIDAEETKVTFALVDVFEIYCKEHHLFISPAKQISKVLLYIADHIGQKIEIEDLCGLAGYNEQYFIRLFKKTIGLTPYQYIISHRLKEAKKLLESGMSITQVAKVTGYSDIKSFSRSFRKNVGLSPSAFKNNRIVQP